MNEDFCDFIFVKQLYSVPWAGIAKYNMHVGNDSGKIRGDQGTRVGV